MNELALFAGAGGGILGGVLLGWHTVAAVELERYPRELLLQRQRDGLLPPFPMWDDVRTFDGKPWRGIVDVVSGGFPCQDISAAGKGAGISGSRSGLWAEMHRIICEVRPRYAFMENSPLLTSRGLYRVLGDLAEAGYNAAWLVLGAADLGLRTEGTEYGFLQRTPAGKHLIPTPTACNAPNKGSNTKGPKSLLEVARTQWMPGETWPTPQASDYKRASYTPEALQKRLQRHQKGLPEEVLRRALFPTPTCQDAKNNGSQSQQNRNSRPLNAVAGGALNPPWVEWLMGWPIGWTDSKPLETDKFLLWQRSLSALCNNALTFINRHEWHP